MKPTIAKRRLSRILVLCACTLGSGWGVVAADRSVQLGYFVDEKMQPSAGNCELIVLRSQDQVFASLSQSGTRDSCKVEKNRVTDFLVRCGEYRRFATTEYDLSEGITAVLVVYKTPRLINDSTFVSSGKFDADYQKRSLFEEGRSELRDYWRTLSSSSRQKVRRAYALVVAPTDGGVYQVVTWFE